MNKVILTGNLTRDPERRESPGGHAITTFTVASPKKTKNADGTYGADFIRCVAWRNTAEFVSKYFTKGSRIELSGSLSTNIVEKDGKKTTYTEVSVEEVGFGGKKETADIKPKGETPEAPKQMSLDEFVPLDDAQLPF